MDCSAKGSSQPKRYPQPGTRGKLPLFLVVGSTKYGLLVLMLATPGTAKAKGSVVITGCTSGTGLVAAKTSVRKGAAAVVMLNRPSDRATKAEEEVKKEIIEGSSTVVETIPCELQDFESIRQGSCHPSPNTMLQCGSRGFGRLCHQG